MINRRELMHGVATAIVFATALAAQCEHGFSDEQPNVIFIICDDLNDYVEGFGGHPDAATPNMARLAKNGVRFTQAHCNIPICGPSRASLFTGIYPHHSGCYGFTKWDMYEVLKNSRTLMDHFRANGYRTLGTGKLMHHMVRQEWNKYGNRADYGPFAFAGGEKVAHPDVPAPFREIGPVDGSFGPFVNLKGRTTPDGKPLRCQNGGWGNQARELRFFHEPKPLASGDDDDNTAQRPAARAVGSQALDRDLTPDELNGNWAVENIRSLADRPGRQPFFMGVGFVRPHTPLIVPQRFFAMFPLEEIDLPVIRPGDVEDTYAGSIRGIPNAAEPTSPRTEDTAKPIYHRPAGCRRVAVGGRFRSAKPIYHRPAGSAAAQLAAGSGSDCGETAKRVSTACAVGLTCPQLMTSSSVRSIAGLTPSLFPPS